jgi:hypothetical protein
MNETCNLLTALVFAALISSVSAASAEQVPLNKPLEQFAKDALGGIRTILQYGIAEPNRSDVKIVFLEGPSSPGGLPDEIQVLDNVGVEQPDLIESEGADCTLQHVALFREGSRVAVITATRVYDPNFPSQAVPGPMEIQIYQLEPDGGAGRSTIVFRSRVRPIRTQPICSGIDLQDAIAAAAQVWHKALLK